MARIFIMGSGVVGTATGIGFVEAGHSVTFIDILAARIDDLRSQGLCATDTLDLTGEDESFIFLTLPTPNVGHAYDLSAFTAGTEAVGRSLRAANRSHTVVVRSTVPPGITMGLVRVTLERESGKSMDNGFCLASNPEFLRAASARADFRWPWMTIIGSENRRTRERLSSLLAPFGGEMRIFDNPATAEFVKCANNIYNAAKISFWNEMWTVARDIGLDDDEIASTVAKSAEGSWNTAYGTHGGAPYGGVCLPKDTKGFLGFAATRGLRMPLLEAVVGVNTAMERLVAREITVVEDSVQASPGQPPVPLSPMPPAQRQKPAPAVEPATVAPADQEPVAAGSPNGHVDVA